jgi:hypothetical protein
LGSEGIVNETCDFSRRKAFTSLAVGASAVIAGAVSSVAMADTASRLLTVGDGGEFPTIQDALAVAAAGATATSPFTVFVLPGVYDLRTFGGPITLPEWVTLVGTHRKAVEIWLADDVFLGFTRNAAISEITFRYRGNRAALIGNPSGFQVIENFELSRVTVYVEGSGAAVDLNYWVDNAFFYDLHVITEGIGIRVSRGGLIWAYNSYVALVGTNTGTYHCGYYLPAYTTRLWLYGGFVGTGYGYPNVSDPDQDVIGIYCGPTMNGRVHLDGVWSICRNDNGGSGHNVINCVRNESLTYNGRVRAFGCYMQAESGDGRVTPVTVVTTGAGRLESYGSRIRDFGGTQSYGGSPIGVSRYSTADDGMILMQESGGLILLDASAGRFTLNIGSDWGLQGEVYIFKKVDASRNSITIQAVGAWTIEGQKRKQLTTQYQSLRLRPAENTWWVT